MRARVYTRIECGPAQTTATISRRAWHEDGNILRHNPQHTGAHLPIRAAVLTQEQMQEFTRTGKIPAGLPVQAFDDMGQALDSAVESQAAGVMAFSDHELMAIADRAARLSKDAITSIDEKHFQERSRDLAMRITEIATGTRDRTEIAKGMNQAVVESFRKIYLSGYTHAIGDAMIGKIDGLVTK